MKKVAHAANIFHSVEHVPTGRGLHHSYDYVLLYQSGFFAVIKANAYWALTVRQALCQTLYMYYVICSSQPPRVLDTL